MNFENNDGLSLQAECPTQSGARAVVAAGEAGRGPIIPVAVERQIPLQITNDLDVVRRPGVEPDAAGIGERRQQRCSYVEIGFAELEELSLAVNDGRCNVLMIR